MDLISAVKSGMPFRREGIDYAYHTDPMDLGPLSFDDINSTDWQLKPEPREGEGCATCEAGEGLSPFLKSIGEHFFKAGVAAHLAEFKELGEWLRLAVKHKADNGLRVATLVEALEVIKAEVEYCESAWCIADDALKKFKGGE